MEPDEPLICTKSQDRDYNCGVFALRFVLSLIGRDEFDTRMLERMLGADPKAGTSHNALCLYMERHGIKYVAEGNSSLRRLKAHLPAIVNHQQGGEGHYTVFTAYKDGYFAQFDPWNGLILRLREKTFYPTWFSKRYGKRWFLHVPLSQ